MGRERFAEALAGRAVAFAPRVWDRLPDLVRQPAAGWWLDPERGRRMLDDAASIAGADALVLCAARDAVAALAAAVHDMPADEVADADAVLAGWELLRRVRAASPYAVIAALPTLRELAALPGADGEIAEDVLSDLARGALEAGADALAVCGGDDDTVARSVERVAPVAQYYGCIAVGLTGARGWIAASPLQVTLVAEGDGWPRLPSGLVATAEDASTWDVSRLRSLAMRIATTGQL